MTNRHADDRRSPRAKVMLAATLVWGEARVQVRVDDLSAHGACVQGDLLPAVDTPVIFQCKDLVVDGFVAWVQEPLAGVGFGEPIQTERAMQNVRHSMEIPRQLPAKLGDFRRPGFRGLRLTEEQSLIVQQWKK